MLRASSTITTVTPTTASTNEAKSRHPFVDSDGTEPLSHRNRKVPIPPRAHPAFPIERGHADEMDLAHEADVARAWLKERGFDVRVEKRNLREDFVRRGLPGADTIDHVIGLTL